MPQLSTPPHAHSDMNAVVETLYRSHQGWLLRWLRWQLGEADLAADLAHDTFVRLLSQSGRQLAESLCQPRAYLRTVARHLVIDHHRRAALEQAWLDTLSALPEQTHPSAERQYAVLQALHRVDAWLAGLPPKVCSAFLMSQIEGLGYVAIAERMGVTERSVKRYMAQAFEHCILMSDVMADVMTDAGS